ncbi:hypothetical protein HF519_27885 [Pseudonocardia bannensis]|uniref:Uncharacterized protein n=1 Tax=Pseudonocardia bannensis TaxID=630973 RepID=A0A848DSC0_9PSEU|nr:hypothetical protein [Pseudonocardia bannensis]
MVLALLAGLVGMHQLPVAGDGHGAATGAADPVAPAAHPAPEAAPAPAGLHDEHGEHGEHKDLLHLCLAVLTAIGLLVAAAVLLGLLRTAPLAPRRPAGIRIRPRGPPPPVPRRLAQLCVLRR